MKSEEKQRIEERLREIDRLLQDWETSEMTEGWLSSAPNSAEVAALYQEREQLMQQLAKAA
jgi:hypothetical protein